MNDLISKLFSLKNKKIIVVGDPGIEPGVRLREGVTVPCHTLRPVAHCQDKPNTTADIRRLRVRQQEKLLLSLS